MTADKKIPSLRFPEFEGEWKETQLDNVADKEIKWSITGGPFGSNLKAEDYRKYGIRIIQLQNIGDGNFVDDYKIYTSEKKADELLSCNIYPHEIILSKMGDPVARACVIPDNVEKRYVMCSDGIRFVVNAKQFNKKFIHDYINAFYFRKQALEVSTGTTRRRIGLSELKKLLIHYPKLPEQQKIGVFLTAVDNKIQQLTKKKTLLEQYKKGVMQQIFSQQIRFKDDDGNDYPDWEEQMMGEVFNRITTKNKNAETSNVLTISAQYGLISQLDFFNNSVASKDLSGYYLLERNDFAYNKSYSNGYPLGALKRLSKYDKGVVSTLYICFRISDDSIPVFYEYYFDCGILNLELQQITQEGARNHGLLNISVIDFFSLVNILKPSPDEQQKIANFFTSIDNKINTVNEQLQKTQQYKKGLLQQMFV